MNYRTQRRREKQVAKMVTWSVFAVCLAATMAYLQSRLWIIDLSYEHARLTKELSELKKNNAALRVEVGRLKSPDRIEQIARSRLNLRSSVDQPESGHVVSMREVP